MKLTLVQSILENNVGRFLPRQNNLKEIKLVIDNVSANEKTAPKINSGISPRRAPLHNTLSTIIELLLEDDVVASQNAFATKLKGLDVGLLGAGDDGREILAVSKHFPFVNSIHLFDVAKDNFYDIEESLPSNFKIPLYGYCFDIKRPFFDFDKINDGKSLDVIFDSYVFDRLYFNEEHLSVSDLNITGLLGLNGLHVSNSCHATPVFDSNGRMDKLAEYGSLIVRIKSR